MIGTCMSRGSLPIQVPAAYVSIRQHTSAYVSIRQHTSAHVSIGTCISRTSLPINTCVRVCVSVIHDKSVIYYISVIYYRYIYNIL